MLPSQRHDEILKILDECEKVEIFDLHKRLGVTEMTVRRDLSYLETKGQLEKIRGGAAKIKQIKIENLFENKNSSMLQDKIAIAKVIPQFIEDNDTVFINSGSTVLQAAVQLKIFSLKIITNNPRLTMLNIGEKSSLMLLGGEFRAESNSIVGEHALSMLGQIYATKCLISVDGVSLKYGLTSSCLMEAGLNRKMIEQTRGKVIVVADYTKIGKVEPFLISPIENIDVLVTTRGFPEECFEQFISMGIEIIVAN